MASPTDRSQRQDASSRPVTARSTSSFIAAVLGAAALAGLALLAVRPRPRCCLAQAVCTARG
jgi:hypothetical protein